jgi:putative acyl-CoA dehydrogenase
MNTLLRFDTPDAFNQSPPFENIDLFSSDMPLREAVKANGAGHEAPALADFGRQWGTAEMFALARHANENTPKLYIFDPKGFRRDVVGGTTRT